MNRTALVCLSILLFSTVCNATSKTRKEKNGSQYLKLIEAYKLDVEAGTSQGTSESTHKFMLVWTDSIFPESFFWRENDDLVQCKIEKAHKAAGGRKDMPEGASDYIVDHTEVHNIKKGDTLMITTLVAHKTRSIPEIYGTRKNSLYFKTAKNNWYYYTVKTAIRKRHMAMP